MSLTELSKHGFYAKVMKLNYKYDLDLDKKDIDKIMEAGYFDLEGHGSYAIKKPLSPEWERYVTEVWQPQQQGRLDTSTSWSAHCLQIANEGVNLGPFDFTNESVNIDRAMDLGEELARWRFDKKGNNVGEAGTRWWPVDAKGILMAVRIEQRKLEKGKEKEAARKGKEGNVKRVWSCDPDEDLGGRIGSKKGKH